MGPPVFQRSARLRTATDVRGQVPAETPRPSGGRPDQDERAVQTGPAPGVRPATGVRQIGGLARGGPAPRAGRRSAVIGHVRGPVRVLAVVPVGRQLFRQRSGPAEWHRCVHARLRVSVQGHAAVRLSVAAVHQLRAIRTPDTAGRRR